MASEKLKGFLQNLAPALASMQVPQPQVTPYPQSGISQLLQSLQGGAANFAGAKDAIEREKVKQLLDKLRFGPLASGAVNKLSTGDTNLSPGEEVGLGALGVDPNAVPVLSRMQRADVAQTQGGTKLSEEQKQRAQQFEKDLEFRQAEMEKNYELKGKEIDQRAKELGLTKEHLGILRDQLGRQEGASMAAFRNTATPQDEQQKTV